VRPSAASFALAALALSGCYATTPHRAEVTAAGASAACVGAVSDVMTRAGMIALMPLPTHYSMFYGPRSSGPGPWPKTTQMGVGVVIREERRDSGAQTCTVTLEAIATDTSCAILEPLSCENPYLAWDRDDAVGAPVDPIMACGSARMCEMSQVPAMTPRSTTSRAACATRWAPARASSPRARPERRYFASNTNFASAGALAAIVSSVAFVP
jgi:hypothetical protein